jgi:hypothetical protein
MLIPPGQNAQHQTAENRRTNGDRVKTSNLTPYSPSAPTIKHHVPYTNKKIWKGIVVYIF